MATRKVSFAEGELYHAYNRGVEKRPIILDQDDLSRLKESLVKFNRIEPIGSIYEYSFKKSEGVSSPLVQIVCYAINDNHFHLLIKQTAERGVEKFMHRLGTGFSMYFNRKYQRSGSLFQGKFQAIHVDTNEYLLRLSVYINLNYRAHQLGGKASKLVATSWLEYMQPANSKEAISKPEIILSQFNNPVEYRKFAEEALQDILVNKELLQELEEVGHLEARPPSGK